MNIASREHSEPRCHSRNIDPRVHRMHPEQRIYKPRTNPRSPGRLVTPRNYGRYVAPSNHMSRNNYIVYINNNKNSGNIDNYNDKEFNRAREQRENLRQSTIDSSIENVGTKSDLIVQQSSIEKTSGITRKSIDYSNMDRGETFKQGGLAGLLDKTLASCTNMTSGQKDTRKTLSVLGCFAGGIFGLYKFYTTKKLKWRGKAGITAATIFSSQAITGKGPITLFSELITGGLLSSPETKNKIGNAVSDLSNSESKAAENTVPAIQSMIIFNSSTTAGEVQQMTGTFGNNKNRESFYNQACQKIKNEYGEPAMQSFQSTLPHNFDEEKRENWLASIGITGATDKKITVHELANNAYMNKVAFEKFLTDNKIKTTTNPTQKAELDGYIRSKNERNETIKFNDLKAHFNDWFITENQGSSQEDPKDKTSLSTPEIEIESKLDESIKNGLDKIYYHFEPKIKKINKVPFMKDIKKTDITKRFPELTNTIKSEFISIKNNNITINIDETKIANIFDDFLNKLRGPNSTAPNYVKNALSNKNRNSLKAQLNEYKNKNNKTKYNNMKENFTTIFNNIFVPIDTTLRNQNISPKIICNGQEFSNINEAINSMNIFK